MAEPSRIENGFSFDGFSFDRDSGELFKGETLVTQFADHPFKFFVMLLDQAQKVVSKKDLIKALWENGIEPDGALRGIVAVLREALGDDPEHPRYIQTIRGRGYKFLKPVERLPRPVPIPITLEATASGEPVQAVAPEAVAGPRPVDGSGTPAPPPNPAQETIRPRWPRWLWWSGGAVVLLTAALAIYHFWSSRSRLPDEPPVLQDIEIISPRENDTVDHRHDIVVRAKDGKAARVCVVILPDQEDTYHTQPGLEFDEGENLWRVKGYFGVVGSKDKGRRFEIRAIAGCDAPSPAEIPTWPPGTARSRIVTVRRR